MSNLFTRRNEKKKRLGKTLIELSVDNADEVTVMGMTAQLPSTVVASDLTPEALSSEDLSSGWDAPISSPVSAGDVTVVAVPAVPSTSTEISSGWDEPVNRTTDLTVDEPVS